MPSEDFREFWTALIEGREPASDPLRVGDHRLVADAIARLREGHDRSCAPHFAPESAAESEELSREQAEAYPDCEGEQFLAS